MSRNSTVLPRAYFAGRLVRAGNEREERDLLLSTDLIESTIIRVEQGRDLEVLAGEAGDEVRIVEAVIPEVREGRR